MMETETVKEIYSFEIPSSTEWVSPYNGMSFFRPNVFTDITDTIELKKRALSCYGEGHNRYNSLFDMTIAQNRVEGYKTNMNVSICFGDK